MDFLAGAVPKELKAADWALMGVPKRYWGSDVGRLTEDHPHREAVLEYVRNLAGNLERGRGMVLSGGPNRGKTTAAAAVLKKVRERYGSGLFVRVPDLDRDFRDREMEELFVKMMRPDLVVLDAVPEMETKSGARLLRRVLLGRGDELKPVLVTTQLDAGKFVQSLGISVVGTLKALMGWVEVGE